MFNFNIKGKSLDFRNDEFFSKNFKSDFNSKNQFDGLNLLNPKDIFDFIQDKEGLIEFILESHELIKKHFPSADLYLEFVKDPEIDGLDSLFTCIVIKESNFEEVMDIYNNLISDLINLRDYQKYSNYYSITTLRN